MIKQWLPENSNRHGVKMIDDNDINDNGWKNALKPCFSAPTFLALKSFLRNEEKMGRKIFPTQDKIFNAFNQTPFDEVKVIILGQDPYHGAGQAHGLSFSVPIDVKIPPSLRNIYQELSRDLNTAPSQNGDLTPWARQGVLLLNSVLTVEEGQAGAHQNKGWEDFTDGVIKILNDQKDHLVFMLWGAYAQRKAAFINPQKHLILTSVHPSPLSAHRGFIGCGHFSKANEYLKKNGKEVIQWV